MVTSIFVLGGIAFYLLLCIGTAFFFFCAENDDQPGWTIFGLVLFLVAWLGFGDLAAIAVEHPWRVAVFPLLYAGVGMLLSFPFWIIFLKRAKREYLAAKAAFIGSTGSTYVDDKYVPVTWTEADWFKIGYHDVCRKYGMDVQNNLVIPPAFTKNRRRLVTWVALWPWKMTWTFCREIVINGIRHLVDMFGGTYQRLSNWIFKDLVQ